MTTLTGPSDGRFGLAFLSSALAHVLGLAVLLAIGVRSTTGPHQRSSMILIAPLAGHAPAPPAPARRRRVARRIEAAAPPPRLARPLPVADPPPLPVPSTVPIAAPRLPQLAPLKHEPTPQLPVFESRPPTAARSDSQSAALAHTGEFASIASSNPHPSLSGSPIPAASGFDGRLAGQTERTPQPAPVRAGGFGEARGAASPAAHGAAVSDGGFGAVSGAADRSARPPGRPASGHFGDIAAAIPVIPAANPGGQPPSDSAVEILQKPRPAYTAEARSLRIEGEVVMDVVFEASGEVVVLGVRKGLGHGLDENAVAAARAIRFHPALRAGRPVDATGIVHIDFELAY